MVQPPPAPLRHALAAQRLLLVSPFPASVRRQSAATALMRHRLCALHADGVLIAHAAPGGKVEALALELLAAGKQVYTLDHPANVILAARGAVIYDGMMLRLHPFAAFSLFSVKQRYLLAVAFAFGVAFDSTCIFPIITSFVTFVSASDDNNVTDDGRYSE